MGATIATLERSNNEKDAIIADLRRQLDSKQKRRA